MRQLQPRTDFYFNGKALSDFGATLYNPNETEDINLLPNYAHNTQEITGVAGSKYWGKTLEPRVEPLNIFFKEDIDVDDLLDWIETDEPKEFYYAGEDRKIMAILNSSIDLKAYYNKTFNGMIEIEMIAYEPYWTEINPRSLEIKNPELGKEYRFYYDGNVKSKPIIRLECTGEITNVAIGFNDYEIEIDRFTQNITIDMRYGTIYTELDDDIPMQEKQILTENGTRILSNKGKLMLFEISKDKKTIINKYDSYKLIGGYHEREMLEIEPFSHNRFRVIRGNITKAKIIPNVRWK